jgi:hypothetical protein
MTLPQEWKESNHSLSAELVVASLLSFVRLDTGENSRGDAMISDDTRYPDPRVEAEFLEPLLLCVFGTPSHPQVADPSWLTPTVVALARGIFADRAYERLPILADALQEAGCDNEDILTHCRSNGPHVPGCWVIALLLGKGS